MIKNTDKIIQLNFISNAALADRNSKNVKEKKHKTARTSFYIV
jgi:hypothetical protein